MTRSTAKFYQLNENTKAGKYIGNDDIRSYKPPAGYTSQADLIETHPATGEALENSEWWIFLTKKASR